MEIKLKDMKPTELYYGVGTKISGCKTEVKFFTTYDEAIKFKETMVQRLDEFAKKNNISYFVLMHRAGITP